MHLSLMGAEEINDSNGSSSNFARGSLEQTTHELCKDSMLEKIVLVSVAYFCIATEMRFLMAKTTGQTVNTGKLSITKEDSEAYHAQALQISSLFLPAECPLVSHVIKSYKRNYLKDRKQQTTFNTTHMVHVLKASQLPSEVESQILSRQSYGGPIQRS